MQYQPRLKTLTRAFFFLLLALFCVSAVRMLWQGPSLSKRPFVERSLLRSMESLDEKGIVSPGENGVVLDKEMLAEHVTHEGRRNYISHRLRFMSYEDGEFKVDTGAVMVTNRRYMRRSVGLYRGRILDCKGRPLATTVQSRDGRISRAYPLGPAAFPLVGVSHPVYGEKGLERALSSVLEGEEREGGLAWLYRFFTGKKKSCQATLTLDATLQQAAYEALDNRPGAVVVVNVNTGSILASASAPSFDPTTRAGKVWDDSVALGFKGPFINRGMQRLYPPGSTFKLVTAAAWMEQEDFDSEWGMECKGRHPNYRIREYHNKRHGWVGLETAVRLSCNVFFAEVGVRLGPALARSVENFGFNTYWPLVDESPEDGLMAVSNAFAHYPSVRNGGPWEPIDFQRNPRLVAMGAVGQNVVMSTPLQIAMAGAAIANDGRLMKPRLVARVDYVQESGMDQPHGWLPKWSSRPEKAGRVCSKKNARALVAMMETVTDTGTGHRLLKIYRDGDAFVAGRSIPEGQENLLAGKTGTAQAGEDQKDHSWFVAVAPVDDPQYCVAVVIEHGGLGASAAGPVAADVMLAALNRNQES